MKIVRVAFLLLLTASLLGGCIVYKPDIQQGNEVTEAMVSKLEVGMTRREVTRVLGTPLINDPFHSNRWDYYYSLKDGKSGELTQAIATLRFENDLLTSVDSSF